MEESYFHSPSGKIEWNRAGQRQLHRKREREWVKLPIIFYFYFLKKEQESKAANKSFCCSFLGVRKNRNKNQRVAIVSVRPSV
jgi:hypothetical protein